MARGLSTEQLSLLAFTSKEPKRAGAIIIPYLISTGKLCADDKTWKSRYDSAHLSLQRLVDRELVSKIEVPQRHTEYQITNKGSAALKEPISEPLIKYERSILLQQLTTVLPDLAPVPWASVWYPNKRVESIRHILEDGEQLGTYRNNISRSTRVSSFPLSIAFNLIRLLAKGDKFLVIDPFMGMGIRIVSAKLLGHEAHGYDIAERIVAQVKNELWKEFSDSFHVGDARNLPHSDESVDLVFTSPPYWNVEKYEGTVEDGQLSKIKTYDGFLEELHAAYEEMKRVVKLKGYIALVVANFRHRGKYYPLVYETEKFFVEDDRFEYQDRIILAHDISHPMGGTKSLEYRHTRLAHEELLIFKRVL